MIFQNLIQNMLLLITLTYLYSRLYGSQTRLTSLFYRILSGILFSVIVILVMSNPFRFTKGIIFDGRSIIVSIAGLFGGFIPGMITMVSAGIYRFISGGVGAITGISVILASGLTGMVFHHLFKSGHLRRNLSIAYLFGLLVHIELILLMFTLPESAGIEVLNRITIPVLAIYPLVTVIVFYILREQEKKTELENNLRQNRRRLNTAQQVARIGHWELNHTNNSFFVSTGLRQFLKIDNEHSFFQLSDLRLFVHLNDLDYVNATYKESKLYKRPYNIEFRMLDTSDKVLHVNEICLTEYDKDGKELFTMGTIQDITQRKTAERKLSQSEERYRTLYKSILDLIIMTDRNFIITESNRSLINLFGYDLKEIYGQKIKMLFSDEGDCFRLEKKIKKHNFSQPIVEIENYRTYDGKVFYGETRISKLIGSDGTLSGFIFIIKDVSEEIELKKELKEYQTNLEDRIKERTEELEAKNEQLKDLNKVFIGRELRIKELRYQIEKLKNKSPR